MQNVIFGLLTGSTLAIAAAGFAMIRQTAGFLNIAHGQYIALGAFVGFFMVDNVGTHIVVAGLLVFVGVGALGVLLARIVFDPVKGRSGLVLLFTSIGLAFILYAAMIAGFGTNLRVYQVDFGKRFEFLSVSVTTVELLIIVLAFAIMVALHLFLTRTRIGTSIRAIASNAELAILRGAPVKRASRSVWFLASGLAGVAGVLLGVLGSVTTEIGWNIILLILAASVLGGLGRIYGVMAAALLLGLLMDLSALVIPTEYRSVVAFGALILVLLVRPEGLFTIERRRA